MRAIIPLFPTIPHQVQGLEFETRVQAVGLKVLHLQCKVCVFARRV